MRIFIAGLFTFCTFWAVAQEDGLIKYWNFDGQESAYLAAVSGNTKPNVSDGKQSFGLYLNGTANYFSIKEIDTKKDFTLSFWVKPINVETKQTLFLQEKINTTNRKTERYLQLGIQNGALFLKDERSFLGISPVEVKDNEWYFVSYSYDGYEAKIIFQGETVYKTGSVTLYTELYQRADELSIGKDFEGASRLEAVLDEVKVYNLPLKNEKIKANYEALAEPVVVAELPKKDEPKVVEKIVEQPKVIQQKLEDEFYAAEFGGRKNRTQHQIRVTDPNIEIEVWDYDEYDGDKISITLNNSPFIGTQSQNQTIQKKRKKQTYQFNLVPEKANYLTFVAEDMGLYDSQNTAAIRLIVNGKPFDDIYKLELSKEENAVLKIVHVAKVEGKTPITPVTEVASKALYRVVIANEVLEPLIVSSTAITMIVKTKNKESLNQKVRVTLDSKMIGQPFVVNNFVSKTLFFNISTQQEKIVVIEANQLLRTAICNAEVSILVDGVEVKKYELQLDEHNILIPVVYVPNPADNKPSDERTVMVTDTTLVFQIKDDSKVDGDAVTIKQGNEIILENYTLTGAYRDLPVSITGNAETTFLFYPASMGSSDSENTASVLILANGEVIHEFSLRSQDKNKPSKLVVIHKGNED